LPQYNTLKLLCCDWVGEKVAAVYHGKLPDNDHVYSLQAYIETARLTEKLLIHILLITMTSIVQDCE